MPYHELTSSIGHTTEQSLHANHRETGCAELGNVSMSERRFDISFGNHHPFHMLDVVRGNCRARWATLLNLLLGDPAATKKKT